MKIVFCRICGCVIYLLFVVDFVCGKTHVSNEYKLSKFAIPNFLIVCVKIRNYH